MKIMNDYSSLGLEDKSSLLGYRGDSCSSEVIALPRVKTQGDGIPYPH